MRFWRDQLHQKIWNDFLFRGWFQRYTLDCTCQVFSRRGSQQDPHLHSNWFKSQIDVTRLYSLRSEDWICERGNVKNDGFEVIWIIQVTVKKMRKGEKFTFESAVGETFLLNFTLHLHYFSGNACTAYMMRVELYFICVLFFHYPQWCLNSKAAVTIEFPHRRINKVFLIIFKYDISSTITRRQNSSFVSYIAIVVAQLKLKYIFRDCFLFLSCKSLRSSF